LALNRFDPRVPQRCTFSIPAASNYLLENRAVSHTPVGFTVDYVKIPGVLSQLAKTLLEFEARGDRAGAETWFTKYDRMPAELTAALTATKGIPVDIDPVFSFPDETR
jgi:hypothetical protein